MQIMKIKKIKKFIFIFLGAVAVVFAISLFLPSDYSIIREKSLSCDKEKVYQYLSDINNVDSWLYISSTLDTTIKYKFFIDSVNNNSSFEWNSDLLGQGKFSITNLIPNERIEYQISYENDRIIQYGKLEIQDMTHRTNLVWEEYGENGLNPVHRIVGLFLDGFLGPDMEKSLDKIKNNLGC